jgi:simple sugar transport system permease protein
MDKRVETPSTRENETVIPGRFANFRNYLSHDRNLLRLLGITLAIFAVMSALKPELFLTVRNFSSMSFQFPEYGILAVGMMLTMITGGIDLSMVGIANLSAILASLVLTRLIPESAAGGTVGLFILAAVALSILTGVACGLLNGIFIARIGITPILATLGTMQLFTGIAIVLTKGAAIYGFPDAFIWIGNGSVWGIPVPLLIFAVIASLFALILNQTAYGNKAYLLGTNATAARFSGIHNARVLLWTYALSGLLSALAGLIMVARTNSAKADYGTSYTLQAILIAVLGGVNPNGGFGTIAGVSLAILSLQFLSSGFNMLRFSNFFKQFIWGAVLILVMVINYYSNKKRSRSND